MARISRSALAGHAVVHRKDGSVIVGLATYDGRAITVDGSQRRIVNGVVEYGAPKRRTIPLHAVRVVLWDDASVTYSHAAGI
jgi:hypothetical protein